MSMRKIFLLVISVLFLYTGYAQDSLAVTWNISSVKTGPGIYTIHGSGLIKKDWHVYQANAAQDLGGVKLSIDDSAVTVSGFVIGSTPKTIRDLVFDNQPMQIYQDSVSFNATISLKGEVPGNLHGKISYEAGQADNFLPEEKEFDVSLEGGKAVAANANRILIPTIDIEHPKTNCGSDIASSAVDTSSKGLLAIFLLGFVGGLVALVTPCVFPMIPLTVSFFTKKTANRKEGVRSAFLYGFFIFLIYVILSLPFHFLDKLDPEILNNISTNVYLNVIFFVIFIAFALSFFGLYEITMPSKLANTADSKSGMGNIAGLFFMALTLALVSFSCTGPILGSLLAGSLTSNGGAWQLTSGMAGFGLALALPFALFALFPNWLNSLPKSGGWLTTVKIVLGFIEVGLAFKFLSNADLVMHWGILKREIFIGIWVIVGICLTLYLLGKLRFNHEAPLKRLPKGRAILAIVTAAFTIYLLPGLTNSKYANLSLISGFPPPLYYSIYKTGTDCVLDLNCTRDYEEGLALARQQHKPILLDFTGYACVNCRRMEENIWSRPEVYQLMKEKFIVISLYVDDKKKLPADRRFTYTTKDGSVKRIETVGDKWATFETENFKNNAQPWYAILNEKEELLSHPVGYVPEPIQYLQWLQCGLDTFEGKK